MHTQIWCLPLITASTHLVVTALLHRHEAAHADGAATIGNTPGEVVHGRGLVLASQAALVALTIGSDVQLRTCR